jgi:hypothetical protein
MNYIAWNLFLNPPIVVTMWLLLRALSFVFSFRLIEKKNPGYLILIHMVHRLRELYETGLVATLAFLAVKSI